MECPLQLQQSHGGVGRLPSTPRRLRLQMQVKCKFELIDMLVGRHPMSGSNIAAFAVAEHTEVVRLIMQHVASHAQLQANPYLLTQTWCRLLPVTFPLPLHYAAYAVHCLPWASMCIALVMGHGELQLYATCNMRSYTSRRR